MTTTFQLAGSMIVSENRNGNIIQYYNEAGSVPFVGRKWARLIDVNKISSSIAGAVTSGVFNFILNKIVPNISIFLSVGGFVAGLLDLLSDGELDNRIVIPFSR